MSKFSSDHQYFDGDTSNEATNLSATTQEHFSASAESVEKQPVLNDAVAEIDALPVYWGDSNSGKIQQDIAQSALTINEIGDVGYYWTMFVSGQYMKTLVAVVRNKDLDGDSILNSGIDMETNLEEIRFGLFNYKDDPEKCATALQNMKEELNALQQQILMHRTETLEKKSDYIKIDPSLYSVKASKDILIREGICQHASKFPVVCNYHLDHNNLDKVHCDRLHMKYDENTDKFVLCDCLKNFSMKRKRDSITDDNGKENAREFFELEEIDTSPSPTLFEHVQATASSMKKFGASSRVVNSASSTSSTSSNKRRMYCSMCSALQANKADKG